MTDLPNLLTDEQRDEYLAAVAALVAATERMRQAITPAVQALLAQFATLHTAMRDAGVIDEHGRFVGGRQDDFALCPQPETSDGDDHA
ncbi:hypothetical protein ACIQVR_39460 [Streptomyces xanthochromogenes]|uniref:hypothetical protein n=1 Tax=Streptomyces xanthochromogenes TaxID=67384 RepID=UPI0038282BFB